MLIASLQNELIKKTAKLKENKYRNEAKSFLLEDEDLLVEALKLNLVTTIFYTNSKYNIKTINSIEVTEQVLKKLSYLSSPNGFVAICKMISNTKAGNRVIVLDGVQDPGNGGTILRSALAFDFDEMILSKGSFDIYNDKFIRSTKGAFFHLPITKVDLQKELEQRKKDGYHIIACDIHNKAITLNELQVSDKVLIIVGNEGQGLSEISQKYADEFVYIPISKNMESLNVSVAASIVMQKIYTNK